MIKAIEMSENNYKDMIVNLDKLAKEIYTKSLNNLRESINIIERRN